VASQFGARGVTHRCQIVAIHQDRAPRGLREPADLLVGLRVADDAAVYRLNDEQAIVATTDFFPPVVDDPYAFGAIAAANALSDIYAMGGDPLFCLNLVGFPEDLDPAILSEILRGGAEKLSAVELTAAVELSSSATR